MAKPKVIFVTDPFCSWCWGMLPDVFEVKAQFAGSADFDLMMAGLQIGNRRPVDDEGASRLRDVWQRVHQTTGQSFSMQVPEDPKFIFHSEIACRSVEFVRRETGACPWEYFRALQESFFLKAQNINDESVLSELCERFDLDAGSMLRALHSEDLIEATRAGFERAKKLGALALPTVLLDLGEGPKLVSGGYLEAEYLTSELNIRFEQKNGPLH
jgi:putative protein-disulfide isomerase